MCNGSCKHGHTLNRYKWMVVKVGIHTGTELVIAESADEDSMRDMMLRLQATNEHPNTFKYTLKFDYLKG